MSDRLNSKSGPIPPEHWDGEPSKPTRTAAGQAQADKMIADAVARGRAVQAQVLQQRQAQQPPPAPPVKPTE